MHFIGGEQLVQRHGGWKGKEVYLTHPVSDGEMSLGKAAQNRVEKSSDMLAKTIRSSVP